MGQRIGHIGFCSTVVSPVPCIHLQLIKFMMRPWLPPTLLGEDEDDGGRASDDDDEGDEEPRNRARPSPVPFHMPANSISHSTGDRVWDLSTQDEQEFLHGITHSLASSRAKITKTTSAHLLRTTGAAQRLGLLQQRQQEHNDSVVTKSLAVTKEALLLTNASAMRTGITVLEEDVQRAKDLSRQSAGNKRKADEALTDTSQDVLDLQARRLALDAQIVSAVSRKVLAEKTAEDARIRAEAADAAGATSAAAVIESTQAHLAAEAAHASFKLEQEAADLSGRITALSAEIENMKRVNVEECKRDTESGRQLENARKQLAKLHRSLVEIGAIMSASVSGGGSSSTSTGGTSRLQARRPSSISHSGVDANMFDSNTNTPVHTSGLTLCDPFGDNLLDGDHLLDLGGDEFGG